METLEPEVLAEVINNKGILTLNRPKAMNTLNKPLVVISLDKLWQWEGKVQCVLFRSTGGKSFCAGGDVKTNTTQVSKENPQKEFARWVYTLVYTIAYYGPPIVAFMDGITMGAGVGVSMHCRYRIATESTVISLPETLIGLFPDVSGTYFLSRLPGKLGLYLGLTGQGLRGRDVVKAGFGTHFVKSKRIPELFEALVRLDNGDVGSVISDFAEDLSRHKFSLEPHMDVINRTFSAPTVEEIIKRLQLEGSDFSLSTVATLRRMSPIALKVCKLSVDKGARMTLYACLQMEYSLGCAFVDAEFSRDLYEGIRALLIDKDKRPKWNPSTLEGVTSTMMDKLFSSIAYEKGFYCKL